MNSILHIIKKIKVNPLFWFILGIGILTGYFREVVMVFIIVLIHELGHAFAANYFKWNIRKIELLPFGGVAEMNESTNRPIREELFVVIAGPLQHVWMIGLSFLFLSFDFWSIHDHETFLMHNLMILGFNLLPIWPLDGGRLLHLYCCKRWPYKKALDCALFFSTSALLLLFGITITLLPFHLNLLVVITFLFVANYLEWKQRHYTFIRFLMERYTNTAFSFPLRKKVHISSNTVIKNVFSTFYRGYVHTIMTKDNQLCITEKEILNAYFKENRVNEPLHKIFLFTKK